MRTKRLSAWLVAALLSAGAGIAAESIQANAIRADSGARRTERFTANLDRYSTDEERAHWREIFATGGQEALVQAWQKENPRVGTMFFSETLGYQIRAAISIPTEGGGRKIFMATERPIAGFEIMSGARSGDYPVGWAEVQVDAEGKGEGRLFGAVSFEVVENRLEMKTWGTQPVQLLNVRIKAKD